MKIDDMHGFKNVFYGSRFLSIIVKDIANLFRKYEGPIYFGT